MSEPLKHLTRPPLPWRDADLTRCGRPVAELRDDAVISFDGAKALIDRHGKQRAAFMLCMVCAQGGSPWTTWDNDPVARLFRELESVGGTYSRFFRDPARAERRDKVAAELRVIALLIEQHRDEFDEALAALSGGEVVNLAARRRPS